MASAGIHEAWQQGLERKNRELKALRTKCSHRSAHDLSNEVLKMASMEEEMELQALRSCGDATLAVAYQSFAVNRATWEAMDEAQRQNLVTDFKCHRQGYQIMNFLLHA